MREHAAVRCERQIHGPWWRSLRFTPWQTAPDLVRQLCYVEAEIAGARLNGKTLWHTASDVFLLTGPKTQNGSPM